MFGSEFETLQRDGLARRIGADLYREAASISLQTVEAVSAAVSRMPTSNAHGEHVAEGFSDAMMADAAIRHIASI